MKQWLVMFLTTALIVLMAFFISKNYYQFMLIQGDSMNPTYHNMQIVVLNKFDKNYKIGDVIAFQCDELDCVLVKRIDDITDGGLYYVLGDNRERSIDSRDSRVGLVNKESVIGVVIGSN